jgi:thioesterase domain-containing protein
MDDLMGNPSEIQFVTPKNKSQLPLILIHDGGSTVYSYHMLGPLDRPVYGIANPRFETGLQPWEGGIPEMATHYIGLIRQVIPNGKILLGGWSLGGLISLEIARQLVDDKDIKIVGMIFIDSVYPRQKPGQTKKIAHHKATFSSYTSETTKTAVRKSFDQAVEMIGKWELPEWSSAQGIVAPPTVLLRARDRVPIDSEDEESGCVSRVDIHREERKLGWEYYGYPLVEDVLEVNGHHYNIFDMDNIDSVTEKLKSVCDSMQNRSR